MSAGIDDDVEVSVFRFTLGIPGFDDALIPRVMGILCIFLITVNHVTSGSDISGSQLRMEVLGTILCLIAIAAPTLQRRIEEAAPGKGRQAAAQNVEGAENCFAIDGRLSQHCREDLAWSSFALLKNCNICGLFVIWNGKVVMCRGMVGSTVAGMDSDLVLSASTASWHEYIGKYKMETALSGKYLENRSQIDQYKLRECLIVPKGAASILILPILPVDHLDSENSQMTLKTANGLLVLLSERERSIGIKERKWSEGVASKLNEAFSSTKK